MVCPWIALWAKRTPSTRAPPGRPIQRSVRKNSRSSWDSRCKGSAYEICMRQRIGSHAGRPIGSRRRRPIDRREGGRRVAAKPSRLGRVGAAGARTEFRPGFIAVACCPSVAAGAPRSEKHTNLRRRCAQHICRRSIAQKFSAVARSLTRMPVSLRNSGRSAFLLPLARTLKTVAVAVATVHRHITTPACSQLVPSVSLTAASSTRSQASATGSANASLTPPRSR